MKKVVIRPLRDVTSSYVTSFITLYSRICVGIEISKRCVVFLSATTRKEAAKASTIAADIKQKQM